MTFSLAARCPVTGMTGLAVASSSPAVGARCAHARARVGAVLSQNITDPGLGPRALDLMEGGASAAEAVAELVRSEPSMEHRQVLAVDAAGGTGAHTGAAALGTWAVAEGDGAVAGGNLLASEEVPRAMLAAFAGSRGHLGDRLLRAMRAGEEAGGEEGPIHSAGLLVMHRAAWPWADLRCDWAEEDPLDSLEAAWRVFAPQAETYLMRAVDPSRAPSYGVPGDEG